MIKKLLYLLLLIPVCLQAQKTMLGTFSPAEDFKWFIIYKLETTHQEYVDNGKVVDGKLQYAFNPAAKKGMYRLVYGLPQEEMNFDFIYDGKEDITFTFGEEGLKFSASKENIAYTNYFSNLNEAKQLIRSFYQSGTTDNEAFLEVFKRIETLQDESEKQSEGMFVQNFIKASRMYVPKSYEAPEVLVDNIRKHYFDPIDFSNPVLLSSDFISEKMTNYVFTAMPMKEMTAEELVVVYKENIATIVEKIKPLDAEIQKTLLNVLWERMVMVENQEIAIHISDAYLTPLAKQLNETELVEQLAQYKRLAIGQVAPEFSWIKDNKTHKLSELATAENYIVVFWSSACSHCLKEMPKLKTFVNSQEKGKLQVIAIGLEDERDGWAEEIVFYPDFIHVLGLEKWENEIGNLYAVNATPTFFILDKDKRIINKPYGVKELKEFYVKE
jgi:thiol-disulfide isomerase/thioredoxin